MPGLSSASASGLALVIIRRRFHIRRAAIGHVVGPAVTPSGETGRDSWNEAQIATALGYGAPSDSAITGPQVAIDAFREPSDRDAAAIATNLRKIKPIRRAIAWPDLRALLTCLRTVKPQKKFI